MSHNVLIKGIAFTNLALVEKAVQELISEGARVSFAIGTLGKPVFIRGWRGAKETVDAAIHNLDGQYDIGLRLDPKTGKYSIVTESMLHSSPIGAAQDALTVEGDVCCRVDHAATIAGKLSQRYNILQDEQTARSLGYSTRRIFGKAGVISLEATQL